MSYLHDLFSLEGKVALVTGASSGLGVQFARSLASAGANVGLAARRFDRLVDVSDQVEQLGRRAIPLQLDVDVPESCDAAVERTVSELGGVDVLVSNAGVADVSPATRQTVDDFRRVVATNLDGCYWMARACARVMKPGSSIIFVSSVIGLRSMRLPQAGYSATKAALFGLTRDLSEQWAGRKGIRVNTIAPGIFPSEMSVGFSPQKIEEICSQTPLGRIGALGELDGAVIFLACGASSYVTGTTLVIDGGWTAH